MPGAYRYRIVKRTSRAPVFGVRKFRAFQRRIVKGSFSRARRAVPLIGPSPMGTFQGPKPLRPLKILRSKRNWLNERTRKTLVYAETIIVQSQTLLTAMGTPYYYALNDVFDPNFTGGGHQPRGFDQLAVLYRKYRVHGARAKFTLYDPSTATMWAGFHLLNSQQAVYTAGTALDYTMEVPGTTVEKVPLDVQQLFFDTGYVSIPTLEGMRYNQWVGDDGFDANKTASPAAISKVGVFCGDMAAPGAVSSITVKVVIEYDVEFYSADTVTTS